MSKKSNVLQRPLFAALACAPLAFLAGCGGGGGGGGGGAAPAAPVVSALVVTSSNAKPVSADALSNSTNTTAADAGASVATGAQVSTGAAGASTLELAAVARTLAAKIGSVPALATGVQATQTVPCSLGGSITVSVNVASTTVLVAGDSMSISASSCSENVDGSPETISGQLAITIVSGSIPTGTMAYPARFGMRLNSTGLSLVKGSTTTVSDGDLMIDMNQSTSNSGTSSLSGSSLANTVSTPAGSRSFRLRNFSQTVVETAGAKSYSVTATIETTNSRLGAGTLSYAVSTPTNLATDASGVYTGGSLKVTGSASALLVTVTGTNQFQIQVDTNGDGTYESTTTATRTELDGLL
jgi:hypothetical protein